MVPELPTTRSAARFGNTPPPPVNRADSPAGSVSTANPRATRASAIYLVSSLKSMPSNVDSPEARPAINNARLVMLFEPGTRTSASIGRDTGTIRATQTTNLPPLSSNSPSTRNSPPSRKSQIMSQWTAD